MKFDDSEINAGRLRAQPGRVNSPGPAVAAQAVDADALLTWAQAKWVTFALSWQTWKTLEVALVGGYRVTARDAVVYEGPCPYEAVKAYNDAA
jgi:hypothetical protein